jgi:hypothetical protein
MGFLGIDVEVWRFIATIVASLVGGGIVTYITLPLLIEKMRADIRKANAESQQATIETAASAIEMASDATKLAQENNKKYNSLEELLRGDLMIHGQFSMEEVIKNGSAQLRGTVTRMSRISTAVD